MSGQDVPGSRGRGRGIGTEGRWVDQGREARPSRLVLAAAKARQEESLVLAANSAERRFQASHTPPPPTNIQ
jgi:hypothetical protein